NRILKEDLSVRKVEQLAKSIRQEGTESVNTPAKPAPSKADFDIMGDHLSKRFDLPVTFSMNKSGKGKITFSFKNEAELERLITIFEEIKPAGH
ncbi:MAG: chromosome partitioning protein ParB, partial [Paramuribaculum sp.]|nr:chromosome partitioning protein ParB [Paramuribaculum sp.]